MKRDWLMTAEEFEAAVEKAIRGELGPMDQLKLGMEARLMRTALALHDREKGPKG